MEMSNQTLNKMLSPELWPTIGRVDIRCAVRQQVVSGMPGEQLRTEVEIIARDTEQGMVANVCTGLLKLSEKAISTFSMGKNPMSAVHSIYNLKFCSLKMNKRNGLWKMILHGRDLTWPALSERIETFSITALMTAQIGRCTRPII